MKSLLILNVVLPMLAAAATIATTLNDRALFLCLMAFVVVMLGLGIVNLVAPLLLWKRHGPKALVPLLSLILVGALSGATATYGSRAVLSGTPASPDTFIQGTAQRELEVAAHDLLSGVRTGRAGTTLTKYGLRADVDSTRRVVSFKHYRMRTWYEYLFAPDGLRPVYSTPPRLTEDDFVNWGTLRQIAEQAAPETQRSRSTLAFEPAIAVPLMRRALGDSLLLDLRRRAAPRPITAADKALVIAAVNAECSVASRLIENRAISYEGDPLALHIGPHSISHGFWVSSLLKELVKQGVVRRAPDHRHLVLRDSLTVEEQGRVAWLQVGLLNFICGELLNAHDYAFERQLQPHWYFHAS